jgi:DNA-cytosine methyltransferase
MKVLSLFDGMSSGQVACQRANLPVEHYEASEIDKYAMTIAKKNYPKTKELGDITKLGSRGVSLSTPDLVMGGSPCQSFSFAGRQKGFKDERGELFWEFMRVLEETKPKYFLLENVRMKKEHERVITRELGVQPLCINSALVSAQNRERLYWTNIPRVFLPENKRIYLKDILECGCVDRAKSYCIDANYFKGGNVQNYFEKARRQLVFSCVRVGDADIKGHDSVKRVYAKEGKSPTLTTMQGGHREPKVFCGAFRGRYKINGVRQDHKMKVAGLTDQQLELRFDGKSNSLTTVQKDNVIVRTATINKGGQGDRIYSSQGKAITLSAQSGGTAGSGNMLVGDEYTWRKLTPLECERLQTLPDNYTQGVSDTQRYKMIGNGWTVDVIAHILKNLA